MFLSISLLVSKSCNFSSEWVLWFMPSELQNILPQLKQRISNIFSKGGPIPLLSIRTFTHACEVKAKSWTLRNTLLWSLCYVQYLGIRHNWSYSGERSLIYSINYLKNKNASKFWVTLYDASTKKMSFIECNLHWHQHLLLCLEFLNRTLVYSLFFFFFCFLRKALCKCFV